MNFIAELGRVSYKQTASSQKRQFTYYFIFICQEVICSISFFVL